MSIDNNHFIIRDNNSQVARILPEKWIEPLTIIARIEGYDSIDDYVIDLVKDRLEMFTDTRDELGEKFQKYMHNIMIGKKDVKNPSTSHSNFVEEEKESEKEDSKKVSTGPIFVLFK